MNISKTSGYNRTQGPAGPTGPEGIQGPPGPPGYNGTQGPPGLGSSSCSYKTATSAGETPETYAKEEIQKTEPNVRTKTAIPNVIWYLKFKRNVIPEI